MEKDVFFRIIIIKIPYSETKSSWTKQTVTLFVIISLELAHTLDL